MRSSGRMSCSRSRRMAAACRAAREGSTTASITAAGTDRRGGCTRSRTPARGSMQARTTILDSPRSIPTIRTWSTSRPTRIPPAAPGVWKATVGTPDSLSLLGAAGGAPRRDALARMRAVEFPLPHQEIRAFRRDGKLSLRFPLDAAEQLYGLGLNFKTVQQRGTVKQLHVDHYGGSDNGRTHAPVPFYVSSAGYGVLVDAPRYITVYAGTAVRRDSKHAPPAKDRNTDKTWSSTPRSDAVEVLVPAAAATLFLFGGPTPLDAVRRYNLYSGGGVLPPKWGLGFLHRVPTLYTADQVLHEVDEFAARGFPLDVVGLEPGWQSAAYPGTFVWDTTRFPDVPGFLREMRRRRVSVNLWINPYVSPRAP